MEFADPSSQTEFNGMLAIIYRLDGIHKHIHRVKAMKNEEQYFFGLHSLFTELLRDITKKAKRGKNKEERQDLFQNDIIKKHLGMMDASLRDVCEIQELKKKGKMVPYSLWKNMFIWNMELNALEQNSGLGLSYGKDPRFAMGN